MYVCTYVCMYVCNQYHLHFEEVFILRAKYYVYFAVYDILEARGYYK